MLYGPPEILRIPCLEYGRFEHVGSTGAERQFLALFDYVRGFRVVLHTFDQRGRHIGTEVREGGVEATVRWENAGPIDRSMRWRILGEMGVTAPELHDIWVRPFKAEIEGRLNRLYGLIYQTFSGEEDDECKEDEWVMLEPHDIMFHPPWDSGEYST